MTLLAGVGIKSAIEHLSHDVDALFGMMLRLDMFSGLLTFFRLHKLWCWECDVESLGSVYNLSIGILSMDYKL